MKTENKNNHFKLMKVFQDILKSEGYNFGKSPSSYHV